MRSTLAPAAKMTTDLNLPPADRGEDAAEPPGLCDDGRSIRYEGRIYIRPGGRGIELVDVARPLHIDEAIELLYSHATGRDPSGAQVEVRIVVELLDERR